jgi:hypothetical protein
VEETFKPIEEYPEYRVSRDGEVQSCWSVGRRPSFQTDTWRRLKPTPQHRGHMAVCLVRGGEKKTCHVHRLVLEAFVGPCPVGMECCHNDGDPANNRLENLRWDTRLENARDRLRHGTQQVGSSANFKLREGDVMEIRRLKAAGITMDELASRFGVSRANIEAIVYRRSWRHIP